MAEKPGLSGHSGSSGYSSHSRAEIGHVSRVVKSIIFYDFHPSIVQSFILILG